MTERWPGRQCSALKWILILLTAIPFAVPAVSGQTSAPPPTPVAPAKLPSFDVISVKPNKSDSDSMSIDSGDGHFDASNVSVEMLLINAYNLKKAQLFGLPKWANAARFDIRAKIIDPDKAALKAMTEDQERAMMEPILTDRFQLKFHHEMKLLSVYELVVAKGGARIKETAAIGDKKVDGMSSGSMSINNRDMIAVGIPMSSLASSLSGTTQRIVVDKTGMAGKYDFHLTWSADDGGPQNPDSTAPPSLFTALQEQLGLKLEPSKAQVETFVVDSVTMPAED
jgi:uncharacterized protein (TIGR03435 family)